MRMLIKEVTLVASIALAGCQTLLPMTNQTKNQDSVIKTTSQSSMTVEQLEDQRWELLYVINPKGYVINLDRWHPSGERSLFDFDKNPDKQAFSYMTNKDDLMAFSFGCNGFSAGFTVADNQLTLDNSIIQTLVGCGDTENELRDALKGQNQLDYQRTTHQLTMTTHNHYRFILQGKPKPKKKPPTLTDLASYDWQLISALQKSNTTAKTPNILLDKPLPQIEQRAKLGFDDHTMYYTIGCNSMSRQFKLTQEGIITASDATTTKKACTGLAEAEAERLLNQVMAGNYQLQMLEFKKGSPILYQTNADKTELTWIGELKSSKDK